MDKEDLIYDLIVCNQKESNRRFDKIESDISDILSFKNKIIGAVVIVTFTFTFIVDYIKSLLR